MNTKPSALNEAKEFELTKDQVKEFTKSVLAKQKELGKYKKLVMTEEVREKKREYYRKNRDRIREQSNKSRAKILATEEGRESARLRTKLWREQNPEKVREINEKRKQKKWEKLQQSQNVTST
jgi:hypothetical protein